MDVRRRRRTAFWCGTVIVGAAALAACAAPDPAATPTTSQGSATPAVPTTPTDPPLFATGDRTPLDCPVVAVDAAAAAENTFEVDEDCAARALAAEACTLTVTDPVELAASETAGATRALGFATTQGERVVLALLPGIQTDNDHEPQYVLACGDRANAAVLTRSDADALLRFPDQGGGTAALERVRTFGADPAALLAPGCPGAPASVTAEEAGRCVFDAWVRSDLWDVGFYAATDVRDGLDGDGPTEIAWTGCGEPVLGTTAESCFATFGGDSVVQLELSIAHDEYSGLRWVSAISHVREPGDG